MRLAIISVTAAGAKLAARLKAGLGGTAELYARAGRDGAGTAAGYDCLGALVAELFSRYDGLVFIMAAGIVVRVIAPHVRDKRSDPAVVVLDEAGEHAISLLSGHIGGANELARLAAAAVGARPVITTATDVGGKPAADILAVRLKAAIEPFAMLKTVNAAIAAGEKVAFFLDRSLPRHADYAAGAADYGISPADMGELAAGGYDAAVVITDKLLPVAKPHVFLRPGALAAGVGCRRGATSAEILAALDAACRTAGRSARSVAVIGTTAAKADEAGLAEAARRLAAGLEIYNNDKLQKIIEKHGLKTSAFVQDRIGVGSVCEPAALIAGRADSLLLTRTVYGRVTVAIAEVK